MTTLFARKALLHKGWSDNVRLTLEGGRIASVAKCRGTSAADDRLGCVIPGLCNAHSHAFQRALAGHTEVRSPAGRDNFWSWRERMYELAGRVGADELRAIARQAYCEMLARLYIGRGVSLPAPRPAEPAARDTMFEAIKSAADDSGIRLTYVPVHYERAGFEDPEPTAQQASFAMSVDEFLQHFERVSPTLRGTRQYRYRCTQPAGCERSSLRRIAARRRRNGGTNAHSHR